MYTVVVISKDGTRGEIFTVSFEGLSQLLRMATPFKSTFEIQRISDF
jgi:hypothetical protein